MPYQGDLRPPPTPDKIVNGTKPVVKDPANVADGVKGENETPADRRADGQGIGVLRQDKVPEGTETKDGGGKVISAGDSSSKTAVAKGNAAPVEDCGNPNMCIDKKSNLVACLRVPGNGM